MIYVAVIAAVFVALVVAARLRAGRLGRPVIEEPDTRTAEEKALDWRGILAVVGVIGALVSSVAMRSC